MFQSSLPLLNISSYTKKPFSFLMKRFIFISKARLSTCKNPMSKKTDHQNLFLQRLTSFNLLTDRHKQYRRLLGFAFLSLTGHFPYLLYIHFSNEYTKSLPSCGKAKAMPQALFVFFLNAYLLISQAESKARQATLYMLHFKRCHMKTETAHLLVSTTRWVKIPN